MKKCRFDTCQHKTEDNVLFCSTQCLRLSDMLRVLQNYVQDVMPDGKIEISKDEIVFNGTAISVR